LHNATASLARRCVIRQARSAEECEPADSLPDQVQHCFGRHAAASLIAPQSKAGSGGSNGSHRQLRSAARPGVTSKGLCHQERGAEALVAVFVVEDGEEDTVHGGSV
jgi:hypothetical protein